MTAMTMILARVTTSCVLRAETVPGSTTAGHPSVWQSTSLKLSHPRTGIHPQRMLRVALKTPCINSSGVESCMCLYTKLLKCFRQAAQPFACFTDPHMVMRAFKMHAFDAVLAMPLQNDLTLTCRGACRVSAPRGASTGGQLVQRALPLLVHRGICFGGWQHVFMHPCGPSVPCTAADGVQQDAGDAFTYIPICPRSPTSAQACCTELHLIRLMRQGMPFEAASPSFTSHVRVLRLIPKVALLDIPPVVSGRRRAGSVL